MKFATLASFLKVLNQWVNDGSKIVDFSTNPVGQEVILLGKDGAKEFLVFYYSDEDYEASDLEPGDENPEGVIPVMSPLPAWMVPPVTHFQEVLDQIVEEQIKYRQQYVGYLMGNPGFIATFGDDFIVEFGEMELSTNDSREYSPLDEYRVRFSQEVRFRRNTDNDR